MARIHFIGKAQFNRAGCRMQTKDRLDCLNSIGRKGGQALLETFGFNKHFPVDIEGLIKRLGIKVIPFDFSELEQSEEYAADFYKKGNILGAAAANESVIGIFYKKDEHINRIRFTLAHELAHCCLHMTPSNYNTYVDFRTEVKATKGPEYEANVFAGEILMPEDTLRYVHTNLVRPYLGSLAKIFGVSETVMKARLEYLNLDYKESSVAYV